MKINIILRMVIYLIFTVRWIYSNIISFFIEIYYKIRLKFDDKLRDRFLRNYNSYMEIKSLEELRSWFKNVYRYKWDGLKGLLDHDNGFYEFFCNFGDCDDMSRYAEIVLKRLGYKYVKRVFMFNIKCLIKSLHSDCLFSDGEYWYLFNYGRIVKGYSKEDVFNKLGDVWEIFKGGIMIEYPF